MGFCRDFHALGEIWIIPDPAAGLSKNSLDKAAETAGEMGAVATKDYRFQFRTQVERNNCLQVLNNGAPPPRLPEGVPNNTRATLFGAKRGQSS